MKKPEFTIFEQIKKGVIKGLDEVRTELKKELFLNTPVDTGYLRDGGTFGSGEGNEIKRKGFTLTIKNEAHYAEHVYYDTSRPWIEEAIDKIDVKKVIQEAVNHAISK